MRGYRVYADFGPGRVFPFYASVPAPGIERAEEHAREAILSGAVYAEVVEDGRVLRAFEPDDRGKAVVVVPPPYPSPRSLT